MRPKPNNDDMADYILACHEGDPKAAVEAMKLESSICKPSSPLPSLLWDADIRGDGFPLSNGTVPPDDLMSLSYHANQQVGIICEKCQVLKILDGANLLAVYGDIPMPGLLGELARDILNCDQKVVAHVNHCRLGFCQTTEQRNSTAALRERHRMQIGDMRQWDVVMAKCQRCSNVAEIPLKPWLGDSGLHNALRVDNLLNSCSWSVVRLNSFGWLPV